MPPPRAAKAAPPAASSSTLLSPSEICSAALFVPASSGADSFSSSTLVEEITSPIPKHPNAQATATVQAGTPSTRTLGAVATAAATSAIPTVTSRSRYRSRRGRDCTQEPIAHVPPPAASENPASVGDRPRWVTSISGTNDSAAMKEPAATPRSSTTEGSPRAARQVPCGSSPRAAGTSRPTPARAGRSESHRRSCAAYCNSPAPSEMARASRSRRRPDALDSATVADAPSAGPPARRRICGRASASGSTTSTGIPMNTQRQPSCSVTAPAASGPTIDGTTHPAANAAMMAGRNGSGYARPTTTYSATITSPPPSPCTARPRMNVHIAPAVPDSSSPAAKPAMPVVSGPSGPRRSAHCPASTMPNRLVVKYPENANAYSDTPCSSRAATGIAVPTAVASKAISRTTETMPMLSARYGPLSTPPAATGGGGGVVVGTASATSASRGSRALMRPE